MVREWQHCPAAPNQSVVVVSHGCAIRCYLSFAKAYPLERLGETEWGSNTGVSHTSIIKTRYRCT